MLLETSRNDYFQNSLDREITDRRVKWKAWKRTSRLHHIVAVGGDSARTFWIITYIVFVVFFILVVIVASNFQGETLDETTEHSRLMTLVSGFEYPPKPHIPYPTCQIRKGFGGEDIELADFAFLARLAYTVDNDRADQYLTDWFGEGVVTNDIQAVDNFRDLEDYNSTFGYGSAVIYRWITFSNTDGVLTIRGTQNMFDVIADAQVSAS